MIGGLAIGTVSTLMFVPVVFGLVHAWLAKRRAKNAAAANDQTDVTTHAQ